MDYPGHFTTFDIASKLDIKRERLKNWLKSGYVIPSFQVELPQGKKSYFNKFSLYMIKLFEFLIKNGVSRQEAAERINSNSVLVMDAIKRNNLDLVDFIALTKTSDPAFPYGMKFGKKNITRISWSQYDSVLIINFAKIRKEVDIHFS